MVVGVSGLHSVLAARSNPITGCTVGLSDVNRGGIDYLLRELFDLKRLEGH